MDDGIPIQLFANTILTLNWTGVFNPFRIEFAAYLLIILILLVATALLCALEVGIFMFSHKEIQELELSNDKTDQLITHYVKKPNRFLATFVLTTTLFTLAIVILFEYFLEEFIQHHYIETHSTLLFIVKISFETFIIVLFAEVIPKIYATQHYYQVCRLVIHPINLIDKLFSPFVSGLMATSSFFERRLEVAKGVISADDIDEAIDITASDSDNRNDTKILKGIVKFGNITVTQIMRSRIDVVAVDEDANFKELLAIVIESGYSRIPVYKDDLDKIVGVIYAKDLLQYLDEPETFEWNFIIRPAFFVPQHKKIDDLLEEFQSKRIHMAIVVDEYGGTFGIVTLEDVLEEVIGDIKDEFDDVSEIDYKKIDNHNYIFEARTAINDVCKILEIKSDTFDEVIGEADSLAGLMLELNSDIPKEGDELHFEQFKFIILEANTTRVIRVKVIID